MSAQDARGPMGMRRRTEMAKAVDKCSLERGSLGIGPVESHAFASETHRAIAHIRWSTARWCRVARMTMPFLGLLRRKRFSARSGGALAHAGSRGLRKNRKRGGGVADSGPEWPPMPMPSASEPFNAWDGLGRASASRRLRPGVLPSGAIDRLAAQRLAAFGRVDAAVAVEVAAGEVLVGLGHELGLA